MPQFIPDARFDNIRKFAHENFVAYDDIWMRFDMLVDQLRVDSQKEQRLSVPQFILKIDLGEGMSAGDIADDLYDVFLALSGGCGTTGDIRDINGNVVGHYEVVDS